MRGRKAGVAALMVHSVPVPCPRKRASGNPAPTPELAVLDRDLLPERDRKPVRQQVADDVGGSARAASETMIRTGFAGEVRAPASCNVTVASSAGATPTSLIGGLPPQPLRLGSFRAQGLARGDRSLDWTNLHFSRY
jgi:hypothetical protein